MLCCSERCEKKNRCALYYRNPQPEYRKYDNLEPLDSHGWGSIGCDENGVHCESHYDCGPLGDYAMFQPILNQVLYEKIADEINSLGFRTEITSEDIKTFIEQLEEKPNE